MNYIIGAQTDIGIRKKTNQDAIAVRVAQSDYGTVIFGIICDGLGGLSDGEVASSHVIKAFTKWFDRELPKLLGDDSFDSLLQTQWTDIVLSANTDLAGYGAKRKISLGTTVSAILLYNGNYYIIHVGDSRIYECTSAYTRQLTNDHSFVAREVALGHLTPEQARVDNRKNVLLQCVGATPDIVPDYLSGQSPSEVSYLLCSDGFRNRLTDEELAASFNPQNFSTSEDINICCRNAIEVVKQRHETDNISAGVIKISV